MNLEQLTGKRMMEYGALHITGLYALRRRLATQGFCSSTFL
jgi:hypothetical protein